MVAPAAPPPAAAQDAIGASTIAVTGSRVRAPHGAGWNACTVDDPRADLAACRKRLAREAGGQAAAPLAEGLDRAWHGDNDDAIAAFDRAIAIAPRSASAWLNRGLAWRRRGELGRALADLDRAVKYGPNDARTWYNRSLVLRAQGKASRARRDEQRAAELDPSYGDAIR